MLAQCEPKTIERPGISSAMLERAGVRRVSASEADAVCGIAEPGLFLPYRTLDGEDVLDGGKPYGRLRLDQPQGSKKYHQCFGTTVHVYFPPGLRDVELGCVLTLVEGEFKATALAEAGFPAIGISGFFGFAEKGGEKLIAELAGAIARLKPSQILFCGDVDTALNYQFSVAAVRAAQLLAPISVRLPRIPVDARGKGVDDCREVFGNNFPAWWRTIVESAVAISPKTDVALLAVELFELEKSELVNLTGHARQQAEKRAVKLAAALGSQPLAQERVIRFLVKDWKLPRHAINKAIKAAAKTKTTDPQPIEACYDPTRKCYWIPNDRQQMIEITETSLHRHLCGAGFSTDSTNGLSLLDEEIIRIQCKQDVLYAGPLAGYGTGLREMCGHRVLVTRAARLIEPTPGACPTIEKLIFGLLHDPQHDQIGYLVSWLKVAYEALAQGELRPGQALAIAGPRDCGKSLLQNLITEVLGGRAAKPYRYMSGGTEFNSDLFGAEHLMIEDEVAFTDIRARRHFGARIKDFTVNAVQSCHGKNRQALSLKPFWRVSITLNDEPENLLILPPIDESLEDKIILLKAKKTPMPMPTGTLDQYKKFREQLLSELPHFLHVLVNYRIPDTLKSERFGVTHFHHPALLSALSEMSPEMRLLGFSEN